MVIGPEGGKDIVRIMRGSARIVMLLAGVIALPLQRATSQGTLRGQVLRDGARTPVAGAEVTIAGVERRALTDTTGAFVLDDLDEGWQIVQVRKIGFAIRRDTVNVRGSGITQRSFTLVSQTNLDTVKTVSSQVKYVSPALRGFEERRANATSGYFVPAAELRKEDGKSLSGVIAQRVSGLVPIVTRGAGTMLASTRKQCSGPVFQQKASTCQSCFVTLYLDGQLVYEADPERKDALPPPDFDRMAVGDYAAVEYYPGSGTAPVQFGRTSSGCGVLLLWTRER